MRRGEIMNAFKTIRTAFIGLTALMTLVTGLPHFRCQCPNGSVKPFCFGYGCSASACCCGGACPASPADVRHGRAPAPGRNRRAACCACATRPANGGRTDGAARAESRVRQVVRAATEPPRRPTQRGRSRRRRHRRRPDFLPFHPGPNPCPNRPGSPGRPSPFRPRHPPATLPHLSRPSSSVPTPQGVVFSQTQARTRRANRPFLAPAHRVLWAVSRRREWRFRWFSHAHSPAPSSSAA